MKKLFEINDIEAINTWLDKEKIFIQKEYKYETNPKNNWHRLYLDIATEFFLEENYSIKIETNIIDFRISLIYYRKWQLVRIEDCYHPNHFKKIPKYIFEAIHCLLNVEFYESLYHKDTVAMNVIDKL